MESTSTGWRELPRYKKSECPKLFYNCSTTEDNFVIRLTDLVAIWECSLDRLQITNTAKEQQSSIDPSESNAQLRVLIEKLQQSLEYGGNYLFRGREQNAQTVYLKTERDLPKPLKPLVWIFELQPQDAGELAEQLLRPCLHEASVTKQKLDSLLRVIKDKDHVLSRLLEKIENSAIDLSLIFPGITGLKSRRARVTVQQAQNHVPGMAEFEPDKWLSKFDTESPYAGFDQMGMKSLVSGCERCPKHTAKQHADWLQGLPAYGSEDEDTITEFTHSIGLEASETTKRKHSSDTDSDFERQPTPPHLKKKTQSRKHRSSSQSDHSHSNSDGEKRPAKKPKLGQVRGPGARSGSKSASREPSSSTQRDTHMSGVSRAEARSQPGPDSETETASESEGPTEQHLSKPRRASTPSEMPKAGKLTPSKNRFSTPNSASPAHESSKNSTPHSIRTKPRKPSSSPSASPSLSHHRSGRDPQHTDRPSQHQNTDSTSDDDLDLDADSAPPTQTRYIPKPNSQSLNLQATNTATTTTTSKPTTPRKLGRLSKSRSISSAEVTPSKPKPTTQAPPPVPEENEPGIETDTDPDSGPPRPATHPVNPSSRSPSPTPSSRPRTKAETEPAPPATTKPESIEEAANRRRAELKSRINSGAATGRKKRKF